MPAANKKLAEDFAALAQALPPPNARWWARRKAAVVLAARYGFISREEACRRYMISPEEFAMWEVAFDRHGIPGLRSTRLQIYRQTGMRQDLQPGASSAENSASPAW
jgi:Protein of unknown function (DUF1153)